MLNVLFSYAYLRNHTRHDFHPHLLELMLGLSECCNVLIDSGAFTNMTMGMKAHAGGKKYDPITIDEYIRVSKLLDGKVWQYIMLDVLKDPVASSANMHKMFDAGLKPMPVYVEGHEPNDILEMVKLNEFICVGGGQADPRRLLDPHRVTNGEAKVHALGYMTWPSVFKLPLYSYDSSSYTAGSRFGAFTLYNRKKGLQSRRISTIQGRSGNETIYRKNKLHILRSCQSIGIPRPFGMLTKDEYMIGGTSIPTITCVRAHTDYFLHSEELDRQYFYAVSSPGWLMVIISTWYHYINPNYTEIRKTYHRMNNLWKKDKTKAIRLMIDMIKESHANIYSN